MLPFNRQIVYICYDGLHRNAVEAVFRKEDNVLGKIKVFSGERSAHVIAFIPAQAHEFFDVFYDQIKAALAVFGLSYCVVHLFSAVEAKHHVFHFAVKKVYCVVVKQKRVSGCGKKEFFADLVRLRTGVRHNVFDCLQAH